MNSVIWKYAIPPSREFTLDMPEGRFEFLSVQMQRGEPRMWCCVDPSQRMTPHKFRVVPTGEVFDRTDHTYLGTFQPSDGLVFHLFLKLGM